MKMKMKNSLKPMILLLVLSICTSSFSQLAFQTNLIYGNITSFNTAGRTNLGMVLSIVSPKKRIIGGNQISDDPITSYSDTNGDYTFTNIQFGFYTLRAQDSYSTTWPLQVFTSTSGSNRVSDLVNYGIAIPPNSWSNYVTWSELLAELSAVQSVQSTNVLWSATTNLSDARPATQLWVYPTNGVPYSLVFTNP